MRAICTFANNLRFTVFLVIQWTDKAIWWINWCMAVVSSCQTAWFSPNSAVSMQTQVAEYKQLKDTLNRIPSLRNPEPAEQRNVSFSQGTPQGYNVREKPTGELREVRDVAWVPGRWQSLWSCPEEKCSLYSLLFLPSRFLEVLIHQHPWWGMFQLSLLSHTSTFQLS